jgi:hypothetical protein
MQAAIMRLIRTSVDSVPRTWDTGRHSVNARSFAVFLVLNSQSQANRYGNLTSTYTSPRPFIRRDTMSVTVPNITYERDAWHYSQPQHWL